MSLEQALKRPTNFDDLAPLEQWTIDKRLGILDWEPTPEEVVDYKRLMNIRQVFEAEFERGK